uniref:VWFA domain-containing protein n=1 Tax=Ciona intestinalis TaxID=7719 RepID=F6U637_CIOIN
RYAETVVTSRVTNNADIGREAEFHILLPADAYIVNLTMTTGQQIIVGSIETKEKAKKVYDKAKQTGKTAGHVAARDKSTRAFKTKLFIAEHEHATFELTYQQLLRRVIYFFVLYVSVKMVQPVNHLTVDVHIVDQNPITFVRVPPIRTEQVNLISPVDVPPGSTVTFGRNRRYSHVRYAPSIDHQTEYSPFGLSGTLVVRYDVERTQMFGDIAIHNGFFAHHFAPPSLAAFPKLVVFVVDTSGSMFGYKLKQVKQALADSLRSLNNEDHFNIVVFGDTAEPWISGVLSTASTRSINDAITYVDAVSARGGTNMLVALQTAFAIIKRATETQTELSNYAKMIVFLTDGRPTKDDVGTDDIASRIEKINGGRVNLHTIGFGSLVDMRFLEKLAALNGGVSRRVFESLDAATQIRHFFDEVSAPVLTDVTIEYAADKVGDVTTNDVDILFSGTEMVVAGKILEGEDLSGLDELGLRGRSFENEIEMDFDIDPDATSSITESTHQIPDFTERLWAFLKVKMLLRSANIAPNETLKKSLREEALNMSLSHNFVTPLTSLVVVRPEDRRKIEEELRKEAEAEKKRLEEPEFTSSLRFDAPESSMRSRGGFSGDPHFIVPLTPKINLCFNWDGEDGEIFNLLYDPVSKVMVNGDIVAIKSPPGSMKTERTYISSLYIVIPHKNFKILVSGDNVKFW